MALRRSSVGDVLCNDFFVSEKTRVLRKTCDTRKCAPLLILNSKTKSGTAKFVLLSRWRLLNE